MTDTDHASGEADRAVLTAAFTGEGDPTRVDLEVRLAGGAPSERYELNVRVPGAGKANGRLRDELTGRDEPFERELDASGRRGLLARLSQTGLLDGPRLRPPFPPDTVAGKITAKVDGRVVDEWYVLLDPAQVGDRAAAAEPLPAQQALRVLLALAE